MGRKLHPRSLSVGRQESGKAILCSLWPASLLQHGFSAQTVSWLCFRMDQCRPSQKWTESKSHLFSVRMKNTSKPKWSTCLLAYAREMPFPRTWCRHGDRHGLCGWAQEGLEPRPYVTVSLVPTPRPGVHLFSRYLKNTTAVVSCVFFLVVLSPSSLRWWNFLGLSFYPEGHKPGCPRRKVGIQSNELPKQTDWF